MKNILLALLAAGILFALTSTPKIFIGAEVQPENQSARQSTLQTILIADAEENLPLTIEFIHSVQKTPVIEELVFSGGKFVLQRTRYKSQGVGLPFDAGDGKFYRDGEYFVFDEMNRHFKTLELRTGKGTRLTLTVGGVTYELYKKFPRGTKIIIRTF